MLRDIKFLLLNFLLVTLLNYALGYLIYREFNTPSMIMIIGLFVVIPVCLVNTVFLFFSDFIKKKRLRWFITYLPILLFVAFLIYMPLNAAYTPLILILSMLLSNTLWNMSYKDK